MTNRDPRSRTPGASGHGGREATQSLDLPAEDQSHPSLALGTHEASVEPTKVDSPQARVKGPTKPPPAPPTMRGDDPEVRVGTVLGSYRVLDVVGKGGMGFVYRAEHVKLGREVALKMLRGEYAKRKDAVTRFVQEARTVNRIRHRNIVDVPDILELDDGTTCIVMEFLRGHSLGAWSQGGVDLPRALAVLVQICDGLSAAHAVGIVHRDLKPDNVIVVPTSDGAELVKLLDFGVAKLLNRDDEDFGLQTAAGSVIGTPAYMSPEQAGGMSIDARSDIYSLGAIMYELFCGQPMFRGRSFGEYVRKHLTEHPVPPRQTQGGAHLDPRLEAIIVKALSKDPNGRYPNVLEMRDAMLHMLGGLETHPPGGATIAPALPSVPSTPALPLPQPPMPMPVHAPVAQRNPSGSISAMHPAIGYSQVTGPHAPAPAPWWVWFVGGAIAVGLGIGGAVWYAGSDPVPAPPVESHAATPPPEPVAPAPAEPPAGPPVAAAPIKQIELRFDSLPSGSVHVDGRSSELCRTPCSVNVDLSDGGPTDRRRYVVRSEGYKDGVYEVDFADLKPSYGLTLERLGAARPPAAPVAPASSSRPKHKSSGKPAQVKDRDTDLEPVTPTKSNGGKIDRSYTRDPFKQKTP